MAMVLWLIGFGLMMVSFSFLFARPHPPRAPRITVDVSVVEGPTRARR